MLHHAVRWNNVEKVAQVLADDDGELIDAMDLNGMTALMTAAVWNSSLEIVQLLCKHGADTFYCSRGQTTLDIAKTYASLGVQNCIADACRQDAIQLEQWMANIPLLRIEVSCKVDVTV